MAGKKMFPSREVGNPFGNVYDEIKLRISFRILAGQIVMQFSDHIEWVRMSSSGARKLAAMLLEKAKELDGLNDTPRPRRVRPTADQGSIGKK